MRILTVRQPWAWAIFHGKTTENRSTNIFGGYRGPVAIHAGLSFDWDGIADVDLRDITTDYPDEIGHWQRSHWTFGSIIGVVDLVDAHHGASEDCLCHPDWAFLDHWHGVLANPRHVDPIPYKGALGLRTITDTDVLAQLGVS